MKYTQGVYDKLVANSAVSQIVGTRIYPMDAPSGTAYSYVTYEVTGSQPTQTKSKAACSTDTLEVVGYCTTYADAVNLGQAIKAALEGESWKITGADTVDRVFFNDQELEVYDNPKAYGVVTTFEVFKVFK